MAGGRPRCQAGLTTPTHHTNTQVPEVTVEELHQWLQVRQAYVCSWKAYKSVMVVPPRGVALGRLARCPCCDWRPTDPWFRCHGSGWNKGAPCSTQTGKVRH